MSSHQREWDEIATQDAEWAILSTPETKHGGWDRDAFFQTGEAAVGQAVDRATALGLVSRASAMDFGCGVGRLTRAMAARFDEAVGIDVSPAMVQQAERLHTGRANVRFVVEDGRVLQRSQDASYDFVMTRVVLQHLPGRAAVETTIGELVRVLRPGGILTLQLPTRLTPIRRLQPRRTAYRALRRLGVAPDVLYGRLGLHPMSMLSIPSRDVATMLEHHGGHVLATDESRDAEHGYDDAVYWVTR